LDLSIVAALAKSRKGLPRKDLAKKLGVKIGGTINRILENIREAGFIAPIPLYGKKKRDTRYRLIDEYSKKILSAENRPFNLPTKLKPSPPT
jgi:hypothetical protein